MLEGREGCHSECLSERHCWESQYLYMPVLGACWKTVGGQQDVCIQLVEELLEQVEGWHQVIRSFKGGVDLCYNNAEELQYTASMEYSISFRWMVEEGAWMLMERLIIYWTSLIESRYVNSSFVSMLFDNQSMARSEKTTRVDTIGAVDFPFLNLCFYTVLVVDIHI